MVPATLLVLCGLVLASPVFSQGDTWTEGARMPVARSESRAAMIDGLIHFPAGFGGLDHHAAYDPAAGSWKSLRSVPQGFDHPMVEAFGGKLYVMKGETYAYTPGADTWERKRSGGHFRSDGAAVAFGEYIYVVGGQGVRPIERYRPATDAWEERASMPTLRGHVQAVVLDGKIWVIGGRAGNTMHRSVDIYDPASDSWSEGPAMNEAHTGHAAAVVDGRIVVAGGEVQTPSGPAIVKSVEIYDPAAGRWVRQRDMPTPVHGCASVAYGGKMYVLGGSYRAYATDNSDQVFIYTPPAGGTAVLPRPAARTDAVRRGVLPPGRVHSRLLWNGRDVLGIAAPR
jgi:N-acetylneuraminic acid mutarotase